MYRHSNLKFVSSINQGLKYFNTGEYQKAIDAFQRAIKIDSKVFVPWSNLGLAYLEQGDYGKAIDALKHAVELQKEGVESFLNLGLAYFKEEDFPNQFHQIIHNKIFNLLLLVLRNTLLFLL